MSEEDKTVLLSVGGSLFMLNKEFILSHDWMLSKMLTSDVPFKTLNGQIYIDIDPISFRLIVSVLQGVMQLELDAPRMSNAELVLLKSTARYLLCHEIEKQLELIISGHTEEIRLRNEEICKITEERTDLTNALKKWENCKATKIINQLKNVPIGRLHCGGHGGYHCEFHGIWIGHAVVERGELQCSGDKPLRATSLNGHDNFEKFMQSIERIARGF